jgi:iron-sulfur cluster repair protein YtfE (RIC family)
MSTQSEESAEILKVLFSQWKEEHRELDAVVRELGDWTAEGSQSQAPNFEEAAQRLRGLKERLTGHFAKEQSIGLLLAEARGIPTPEIEAVQRQANKDHAQLTERLDKLIECMDSGEGESQCWDAAIYEFNLFLDVLEQHEELEAESVRWLIPTCHHQ